MEDFGSALQKPATFEGSGTEVPFIILGDEAYTLKTYIMKPFARKDLSCEERVFNNWLSRASRCVECAFVIITVKWQMFNKAMETNLNKAERIVRCICLLHNIIIDILYILLGISPASNCSWPTFRNPVSVPSSKAGCRL